MPSNEDLQMTPLRLRDRLWLWGMKVNALQQTAAFGSLGFADSTMDTETAIRRTGITSVLLAGGLPLSAETLASIPSARRLIAKDSLHRATPDGGSVLDPAACTQALRAAKALAAADPRVEAFLLDDLSTGSIAAGSGPEHLQHLQFINATEAPQLPLMGTVYEMSLEDERVWPCLPHFAGYLSPLWHAADIERYPAHVARLSELSGGKPQLGCIYLFDFGNQRLLTCAQMQRQLEVAEELLRSEVLSGLCVLGTCMMDLPWEANRCLYEWLEHRGDVSL
jgi:hypothetical protein